MDTGLGKWSALTVFLVGVVYVTTLAAGLATCGLWLSGALCLIGVLGPAIGDMRLQRIGVLGYAGLLPLVCLALAKLFREGEARVPIGTA